ncbi:hypothetical protein BST61_g10893 [Cercospora zeina]
MQIKLFNDPRPSETGLKTGVKNLHTRANAERWAEYDSDDSEWSEAGTSNSESLSGVCESDLEVVESDPRELKRLKAFVSSGYDVEQDTEKQFCLFYEREKAKIFKPQFHAADIEPGAMECYAELQQFQAESRIISYSPSYMRGKWAQTLLWLDVHQSEHRLVLRDMVATYAFVGLFFPAAPEKYGSVIAQWRQMLATRTKLVDNEHKKTQFTYYRDWRSNVYLPRDFWPPGKNDDTYLPLETKEWAKKPPREWDAVTRPIIARLYKAGIVMPLAASVPDGRAIARKDRMTGQQMILSYGRSDWTREGA